MKVRQDAWSHEDDLLLAETVLRYIREGGTQLGAFEEVGDRLNRTSAACGFRWNAEVRKNYDQAISIAKRQRKERKRALDRVKKEHNPTPISTPIFMSSSQPIHEVTQEEPTQHIEEFSTELLPVDQSMVSNGARVSNESITLEDCISFLSNLRNEDRQSYIFKMENDQLKRENEQLHTKNKQLEKRIEKLTQEQTTIQEDYQALVQIMDRARRMVMFEDNEDRNNPTFRMDKNGNLEQLAK
ncbi:RsfA family transcriptional regulator [Litchfieldia salsa]|nr:RsfA family transcriptional regulator [Litchfieldia salsa]